ncbi:putative toxin-antitoxin system, antitoxin component, ribbon-helix-helix domain protein [delta proteobacterium NaphS2]|nr:putative toxin-antitoxin system, antitoxin component, ribbon-helix-helix domain protein [delta proteobacterium NaphS2]
MSLQKIFRDWPKRLSITCGMYNGSIAQLSRIGIDNDIYAHLKALAAAEHRSVSQQVLFLVRAYLARTNQLNPAKTSAEVLLDLAGSWEDPKGPEKIIETLRSARKSSRKLTEGF